MSYSLKGYALSEKCERFADAEDMSRHMSRKTSLTSIDLWRNRRNTIGWPSFYLRHICFQLSSIVRRKRNRVYEPDSIQDLPFFLASKPA